MMARTAPVLLDGQHLHNLSTLRAIHWLSMYPNLVLQGTVAAHGGVSCRGLMQLEGQHSQALTVLLVQQQDTGLAW